MIVNVFAVKDAKVGVFGQPFFAATIPAGIRMFSGAVADPSTMLCKYPGDFSLWHLGAFDDSDGRFTQREPYQVCAAVDVVVAPTRLTEELFSDA